MAWISFNSTTTDSDQTLRQFGSGGTFFKLIICNGRDISALSLFADESELLLLPNSVFKVLTVLSSREVSSRAVPAPCASGVPNTSRSTPQSRVLRARPCPPPTPRHAQNPARDRARPVNGPPCAPPLRGRWRRSRTSAPACPTTSTSSCSSRPGPSPEWIYIQFWIN